MRKVSIGDPVKLNWKGTTNRRPDYGILWDWGSGPDVQNVQPAVILVASADFHPLLGVSVFLILCPHRSMALEWQTSWEEVLPEEPAER